MRLNLQFSVVQIHWLHEPIRKGFRNPPSERFPRRRLPEFLTALCQDVEISVRPTRPLQCNRLWARSPGKISAAQPMIY